MSALDALLTRLPPAASRFADHSAVCCATAKAWLATCAAAPETLEESLVWVKERWSWGPHPWPLYWCEAVNSDVLDCGGLAAMALAAARTRGVDAVPVQLVEHHDRWACEGWSATWTQAGLPCTWVTDQHAYHEAIAWPLAHGTELAPADDEAWHLWDPTNGRTPVVGPRGVLAVRVHADRVARWSGHRLRPGVWETPWGTPWEG